MENTIQIEQAQIVDAINRSEIDMQIATAKQYPRDIRASLDRIRMYGKADAETARECFYTLPRKDENGKTKTIEGLSVRMAEIIAGAWGNLRVQSRIIGNDGKTITAQGICHDLETNLAVSVEVKRRITNKWGKTYSEDMQITTGNAASSIAFRNAVLKVVPKAVTKPVIDEIRAVALGTAIDLKERRQNAVAYFGSKGVTLDQMLGYFGISSVDELDNDMVFELSCLKNAIKEGSTTLAEAFAPKGGNGTDTGAVETQRQQMRAAGRGAVEMP